MTYTVFMGTLYTTHSLTEHTHRTVLKNNAVRELLSHVSENRSIHFLVRCYKRWWNL